MFRSSYGLAGAVMTKDVGKAIYASNSLRDIHKLIELLKNSPFHNFSLFFSTYSERREL